MTDQPSARHKWFQWRRLTLRRADGVPYLDRWGVMGRWFSVYVHRMEGPDTGRDLHDHPWSFTSIVLAGGYVEERTTTNVAVNAAQTWQHSPRSRPFFREHRARWSVRRMQLNECHRIVELDRCPTWTLVVCGPKQRTWGFYTADGWVRYTDYDTTLIVTDTLVRGAS